MNEFMLVGLGVVGLAIIGTIIRKIMAPKAIQIYGKATSDDFVCWVARAAAHTPMTVIKAKGQTVLVIEKEYEGKLQRCMDYSENMSGWDTNKRSITSVDLNSTKSIVKIGDHDVDDDHYKMTKARADKVTRNYQNKQRRK